MLQDRTLYLFNTDTGLQIDPETITMSEGVIQEVTSLSGEVVTGTNIAVMTPRDVLYIPDLNLCLCAGDEIYLDNQSTQRWTIRQGWYEVDGNPAIYGWYLESIPVGRIRSFYMKDINNLTIATRRLAGSGPIFESTGG